MKIEVGGRYAAIMPNETCELGEMEWTAEIVHTFKHGREKWHVGIIGDERPNNQSARIFDSKGCEPDMSQYACGMKLIKRRDAS